MAKEQLLESKRQAVAPKSYCTLPALNISIVHKDALKQYQTPKGTQTGYYQSL